MTGDAQTNEADVQLSAPRLLEQAIRAEILQRSRECGFDLSERTLSYAFDFGNAKEGSFSVRFGRGRVDVSSNVDSNADLIVKISSANLASLVSGKAHLLGLFGQGKIGVMGDLSLVQPLARLVSTFGTPTAKAPRMTRANREVLLRKSAAQPRISEVPRRAGLAPEDFRMQFAEPGLPVIVTDVLGDWEISRWTLERLVDVFGDLNIVYRRGPEVVMETMAFRDFCQAITANTPGESNSVLYIDNERIPPELKRLLGTLPYASEHDLDHSGSWMPNSQGLFLGPAGTITRLHWDMADNFLAQLWGSKRITLLPPSDCDNVYMQFERETGNSADDIVAPHLRASVDPCAPDYERFPRFSGAKPVDCRLRAGECLYIPAGWLHRVESLSLSLSINHLLSNRLPAALSAA